MEAEYQSKAESTKDIRYYALTGEQTVFFWECLWENWPRYNGTALYMVTIYSIYLATKEPMPLLCWYLMAFQHENVNMKYNEWFKTDCHRKMDTDVADIIIISWTMISIDLVTYESVPLLCWQSLVTWQFKHENVNIYTYICVCVC